MPIKGIVWGGDPNSDKLGVLILGVEILGVCITVILGVCIIVGVTTGDCLFPSPILGAFKVIWGVPKKRDALTLGVWIVSILGAVKVF